MTSTPTDLNKERQERGIKATDPVDPGLPRLEGIPEAFYEGAAKRTQESLDGLNYGLTADEHESLGPLPPGDRLAQLMHWRHRRTLPESHKTNGKLLIRQKQAIDFTLRFFNYFELLKD